MACALEKSKVITTEVDKLLEVGFIREVAYLDWLANVVLVPKSNEQWQMCVDFADLNKASRKIVIIYLGLAC